MYAVQIIVTMVEGRTTIVLTVCLISEAESNEGIQCEGGIANPRGTSIVISSHTHGNSKRENRPIVPVLRNGSNQLGHLGYTSATHQFLVPPINSGRLNVGLATTAPNNKIIMLEAENIDYG